MFVCLLVEIKGGEVCSAGVEPSPCSQIPTFSRMNMSTCMFRKHSQKQRCSCIDECQTLYGADHLESIGDSEGTPLLLRKCNYLYS